MALVFLCSGAYDNYINGTISMGAPMALWAFETNLGMLGKICFSIILPLFAFTTVLSWSFYGEKGIEYLFGERAILPFKICYVLLTIVGATQGIDLIWNLSNMFTVLMAVPNLVAILLLSPKIKEIVDNYLKRRKGIELYPMLSFHIDENNALIKELEEEKLSTE